MAGWRFRRTLVLLVCTLLPLGCAAVRSPRLFFGQYVEPGQPTATLVVNGQSKGTLQGRTLLLQIANRGSAPIRFSYIADRYVARTSGGRARSLDKDFLHYPVLLEPGDEVTVKLLVPGDLKLHDLMQIEAVLNDGHSPLIIYATDPPAKQASSSTRPRLSHSTRRSASARPPRPHASRRPTRSEPKDLPGTD